jgi:hypothetical protein
MDGEYQTLKFTYGDKQLIFKVEPKEESVEESGSD